MRRIRFGALQQRDSKCDDERMRCVNVAFHAALAIAVPATIIDFWNFTDLPITRL